MGMCKTSCGVIRRTGKVGSLKVIGKPNTREDLYDEKTGKLLQQRWYGPDGKAIHNRDWFHGEKGGKHVFPHDHTWDYSQKYPRQDYDGGDIDRNFY